MIEKRSTTGEDDITKCVLDLGRFSEVKSLGRGKFGEVKLHKEKETINKVAVKFLDSVPEEEFARLTNSFGEKL